MKSIACPVCNNFTVPEDYTFEICPVCYWQDEGLNRAADPSEVVGGPNEDVSLDQTRVNYKEFSAIHRYFIGRVRKPEKSELPELNR